MPVETPMTVEAREIQKGDWVFDRFTGLDSTKDYSAFEIKHGHKYVTIKNANGEILSRRLFDEKVSVERMMPTAEEIAEKEAQREARKAEDLEEDIANWVGATLENYGQQSNSALAMIAESPGREFSGRSGLIYLLNLGAYHYIATRIKYLHDYKGEDGTENRTWAQAYQMWRESTVDATMSRYQSYPFQKDVIQMAMDEATNNAERTVYHALDYGSFSVR